MMNRRNLFKVLGVLLVTPKILLNGSKLKKHHHILGGADDYSFIVMDFGKGDYFKEYKNV